MHFKTQLSSILPQPIAQNIKTIVHTHNQLIYNHYKDTKDKKLANLCVSTKKSCTIPADNQPSQTKVNSELVRCIPDSLPLTESGRLVLSKGFKFVPLRLTTSKYNTLLACERFFRTLRWMAVLR